VKRFTGKRDEVQMDKDFFGAQAPSPASFVCVFNPADPCL
jgi:hypothetical protein